MTDHQMKEEKNGLAQHHFYPNAKQRRPFLLTIQYFNPQQVQHEVHRLDSDPHDHDTTMSCCRVSLSSWGGTNRNRNRRQGGQGQGQGGGGGGGGPGGNGLIPKLIENRDKISRSVVDYSDGDQHGVRTVTGAKNSVDNKDEINDWIYAHVQEMQQLLDNGGMIRGFDGLFQEIIENYDLLNLNCQQQQSSDGKVVCTHTSDDCQGEKLARAHAEFVSLVLKDIDTKDKNNAYLIDEQKCSQS